MKKISFACYIFALVIFLVGCNKDSLENAKIPEDTSKIIEVKDVSFSNNELKAKYTNTSDKTYYTGADFLIYKFNNGNWEEVKFDRAVNDILYIIDGKSTFEDSIFLTDINNKALEKGIYRIRKNFYEDEIRDTDSKNIDNQKIDMIIEVK